MRKKKVTKHYELTEYENKCLSELVIRSGSSHEVDVIRDLILGSEIIEKPGDEFYKAIGQIRKIGVNINQIAHIANATGAVDAALFVEEAKKLELALYEIKRIVLEPRMRKDAEKLDRFLEYAIFNTEAEEAECQNIRESLRKLFDGTVRREAYGDN